MDNTKEQISELKNLILDLYTVIDETFMWEEDLLGFSCKRCGAIRKRREKGVHIEWCIFSVINERD
jgi:hypothetical protein